MWVSITVALVFLVLLLIFILQNGQRAKVSFFGAHGSVPLGVALLLAAVIGGLLVAFAGVARIMQIRTRTRRQRSAPLDPDPEPVPGGGATSA